MKMIKRKKEKNVEKKYDDKKVVDRYAYLRENVIIYKATGNGGVKPINLTKEELKNHDDDLKEWI